jgi:DNA-directed RNA polymerase specialized sigma24 family protein
MTSSDNSIRRHSIWLADVDSQGRRLHPIIEELAYSKVSELARYRADEIGDDAQISTLVEEAVYRTSEAAFEKTLDDPFGYFFRTYTNLVDRTLRKTIKSFGLEQHVLAHLARSESPENEIINELGRQQILNCMDERGRELWDRRLLGYTVEELAAQEGQNGDHVGKRLRRAMQGAVRRLLLGHKSDKKYK